MQEKPLFIYNSDRLKHRVLYAETPNAQEELAARILRSGESLLGFDTEMIDTRLSSLKMVLPGTATPFVPTVMIQLATSKEVAIFHFHQQLMSLVSGQRGQLELRKQLVLPPSLRQLLRSDKFVKIGVATHNDTQGLMRTFGLESVTQLLDIRALGVGLSLPFDSLQKVAYWCNCPYKICKDKPHDWSQSLQDSYVHVEEIEYAAVDAIVCFEAMMKVRVSSMLVNTPMSPNVVALAAHTIGPRIIFEATTNVSKTPVPVMQ